MEAKSRDGVPLIEGEDDPSEMAVAAGDRVASIEGSGDALRLEAVGDGDDCSSTGC